MVRVKTRTPHGTEEELIAGVLLPFNADRDSRLSYQYTAHVVKHRDGGDFCAVEELEDEHADEQLCRDDQ